MILLILLHDWLSAATSKHRSDDSNDMLRDSILPIESTHVHVMSTMAMDERNEHNVITDVQISFQRGIEWSIINRVFFFYPGQSSGWIQWRERSRRGNNVSNDKRERQSKDENKYFMAHHLFFHNNPPLLPIKSSESISSEASQWHKFRGEQYLNNITAPKRITTHSGGSFKTTQEMNLTHQPVLCLPSYYTPASVNQSVRTTNINVPNHLLRPNSLGAPVRQMSAKERAFIPPQLSRFTNSHETGSLNASLQSQLSRCSHLVQVKSVRGSRGSHGASLFKLSNSSLWQVKPSCRCHRLLYIISLLFIL